MREDGVQDLQRQVQQTDACVRKSQSTVLEEGAPPAHKMQRYTMPA